MFSGTWPAAEKEQEKKMPPAWLSDVAAGDICEPHEGRHQQEWVKTEDGVDSLGIPERNQEYLGVLSLILEKLQEQSQRMDYVSAVVSQKNYHTCFDVVTMLDVRASVLYEENLVRARNTVEYEDLMATITISFFSGEFSLLLDECDDSIDFSGLRLISDSLLACHLIAGPDVCRIVVDVDTSKISDITQLTLVAKSDDATRELYAALGVLCGFKMSSVAENVTTFSHMSSANEIAASSSFPSTGTTHRSTNLSSRNVLESPAETEMRKAIQVPTMRRGTK